MEVKFRVSPFHSQNKYCTVKNIRPGITMNRAEFPSTMTPKTSYHVYTLIGYFSSVQVYCSIPTFIPKTARPADIAFVHRVLREFDRALSTGEFNGFVVRGHKNGTGRRDHRDILVFTIDANSSVWSE